MEPTEDVFDRRVRRTRAALRAAIFDLVSVKDYDKITVADILLRGDVARGTFYSHYADRDALFRDAFDELVVELLAAMHSVASIGTVRLSGLGVRVLFQHAQDHRDVYLAMLNGAAGGGPLRRYVDGITTAFKGMVLEGASAVAVTPRMPVDAIAQCWAGEQLALTAWWLRDNSDVAIDDLARMRMHLMTGGATWAYGLEPGQLVFDDQLPSTKRAASDRTATVR